MNMILSSCEIFIQLLTCSFDITQIQLVNKYNPINANFVISDLTTVQGTKFNARESAANAVSIFLKAIHNAGFEGIRITNGYRSHSYQQKLFDKRANLFRAKYADLAEEKAETFVAKPGNSEHQLGLAFDISYGPDKFKDTPAAIWMSDHCSEYGFILRYPKGKENITGTSFEPWHFRYVGVDLAQYLTSNALILEEFYEHINQIADKTEIQEVFQGKISKSGFAMILQKRIQEQKRLQGEKGMNGFSKKELSDILAGHYVNDFNDKLFIYNFEIEPNYLNAADPTGNCFISISNARWNSSTRKNTKWVDGNRRILDHYHKCELMITEEPIEKLKDKVMQLIVKDSYAAIGKLAKAGRAKMKNPVIGITGSVGKSTTRLILEHLLSENHAIVATRGNHNTQVGVLFHGTKLCKNPDFGLIEISLNALNNRGNQSLVIQPDICIFTSIGEAHLSTLHSTENIARLKSRIFAGLKPHGLAIINRDIKKPEFDILFNKANERTDRIKTYSMTNPDADIFLKNISHTKYASLVQFNYNGVDYQFEIKMPSTGVIENALGAFLCLAEMNYNLNLLLPKMYEFKSLNSVMELKKLETVDHRVIDILDDTHNAAIPSMLNAIETFKTKQKFYNGSKILVLGQVADLGEESQSLHDNLLPKIISAGADYIFGHGDYMRNVIKNIPAEKVGGWFDNADDLSNRIPLYCSDDSLVLLKGSVSGSDFHKTSRLLPQYIKTSDKKLSKYDPASIADILQPSWGVVGYNMTTNKKVFTEGDAKSSTVEGLGPILLLYLITKDGIKNDIVALKKWPTNKGKSLQDKPFKTGEPFSIIELVEDLKIKQHPSAIFELANYYYGCRKVGFEQIDILAKSIGLTPSAVLNLTGRYRVKEQQSYNLEDLIKVGKIYFQFNELRDSLPIIKRQIDGIEMNAIFWGNERKSAICFYKDILICMTGLKTNADQEKVPLTFLKSI